MAAVIAPDGTRIELTFYNGGSGDNYSNTIFDDEAAVTIGIARFLSGGVLPARSLAPSRPSSAYRTHWAVSGVIQDLSLLDHPGPE